MNMTYNTPLEENIFKGYNMKKKTQTVRKTTKVGNPYIRLIPVSEDASLDNSQYAELIQHSPHIERMIDTLKSTETFKVGNVFRLPITSGNNAIKFVLIAPIKKKVSDTICKADVEKLANTIKSSYKRKVITSLTVVLEDFKVKGGEKQLGNLFESILSNEKIDLTIVYKKLYILKKGKGK